MKNKELEKIICAMSDLIPGSACKGRLIFLKPIDWILAGVFFEPSRFSKSDSQIHVFLMVLCVPDDSINLTIGFRLTNQRGEDIWSIDDSKFLEDLKIAISKNVKPFLEDATTVSTAIRRVEEIMARAPENLYLLQSLAYLNILEGDCERASNLLAKIASITHGASGWRASIFQRSLLLEKLLNQDHRDAATQLSLWRESTIGSVNLIKNIR